MTRRSLLFAAVFAVPPEVEIRGVIERVELEPGRMPNLEIRNKDGIHHVLLGSMRYLLEKNFNPKAGSTAIVKGFRSAEMIIARTVEIPEQRLYIELRDKQGMPVWRGPHHKEKKK